ncbi:MAG: protein kinase domain-containing protein [Aureliella sp.]
MPIENSHPEEPDEEFATYSDAQTDSSGSSVSREADDPFATEQGEETGVSQINPEREAPELGASRERFRKIKPHAAGGLGRVWVAEDTEINRAVALKEILPTHADDPRSRHRFLREAEITGALEHPGIVPVYGLGIEEDGRPFYAMRMIEGTTLKSNIEDLHSGRPSSSFHDVFWRNQIRKVLSRFIVVCETIAYAHSRGVIHRDIKPSNIMFGEYGETIVVDWGLAKRLGTESDEPTASASATSSGERSGDAAGTDDSSSDSSSDSKCKPLLLRGDSHSDDTDNLTMHGVAIGTPAYMSPEQASGGSLLEIGPASDIYSLGASLFQILTGEPPAGSSQTKDSSPGPKDWQTKLDSVPKGLGAVCRKALAKDPSDRYPTANGLARDIECWLNDQPLQAYSESTWEKTMRWLRTHPTLATTSCAVIILSVVGSLIAFGVKAQHQWELLQGEQERQLVEQQNLNQIQSIVSESKASAESEIRNSRFEAAVEFLDTAIDQAKEHAELADMLPDLERMRRRTQRLLDFYHFVDIAEELTFTDHSRRSSVLFQRALTILGTFEKKEWWNSLPTQDLDENQIHRLREQAYRAMFLLAALRLKETIPADLNVSEMLQLANSQSKESNQAAQLLFDQLDAYRPSQGSVLGRRFATERVRLLTQMLQGIAFRQKVISWDAKNMADLYVMGTALAYMAINTTPQQRSSFEAILGIVDAAEVSEGMLDNAASLAPDHYWTQMVRGFFEAQRDEPEFAERSYSHAIALQPDRWIGYTWRGRDRMEQTLKYEKGDPEIGRILQRSLRDMETAMYLNPNESYVHYHQGLLAAFGGSPVNETTSSFLQAIELQEPIPNIRDAVVENITRDHLEMMRNWCDATIVNFEGNAELNACLALAHFMLGNTEAAERAAQIAIQSSATESTGRIVLAKLAFRDGNDELVSEALERAKALRPSDYAVWELQAKLDEKQEQWSKAHASFSRALTSAKPEWQKRIALRGLLRCSLRIGDQDKIESAIQNLMNEPLTDRLERELNLAISTEQRSVQSIIENYHNEIAPVLELGDESPVENLALLNGDFELGISASWGDELARSDEPVWKSFNGMVATARVEEVLRTTGGESNSISRALHIQSSTTAGKDAYAEMFQSFPASIGQVYRLSCESRSDTSNPGSGTANPGSVALKIEMGEQNPLMIPLPSDSSDWQTLSHTFECNASSITLRIQCSGQADLWIDSIKVQRVEDSAETVN